MIPSEVAVKFCVCSRWRRDVESTAWRAAILLAVAGILHLPSFLFGQQQARGGAGLAPERPAVISTSVRLENWGRIHLAAPGIIGWRIGIPSNGFGDLTFSEAAARVDALNVAFIQGSAAQEFSREIPKKLDHGLAPGELNAVRDRLRSLNLQVPVYFVASIGGDENTARKVFQFAKGLDVETIVSSPDSASLTMLDGLANEYGVNLARYKPQPHGDACVLECGELVEDRRWT